MATFAFPLAINLPKLCHEEPWDSGHLHQEKGCADFLELEQGHL